MEYLSPGVFIEEVPARLKAIEGVSTSTAGFVGVAERGRADWQRPPSRVGQTVPLPRKDLRRRRKKGSGESLGTARVSASDLAALPRTVAELVAAVEALDTHIARAELEPR